MLKKHYFFHERGDNKEYFSLVKMPVRVYAIEKVVFAEIFFCKKRIYVPNPALSQKLYKNGAFLPLDVDCDTHSILLLKIRKK